MSPLDLPHSDVGPRDALPFVLLHGFPLDHTMWASQVTALKAAGFRVLAPDLRGHGKAPVGKDAATMATHADDVQRMLERAGVRRFALVGFSMGGYVALELARRLPDALAGLLLVDTRAEPDTPEAKAGRAATAEKVRAQGMQVLVDAMLPKLFTPAAPPAMVDATRAVIMRMPPEGAAQSLVGMGERSDARAWLASVHAPTLIIVGADDAITPPAAAQAMHASMPGSTLKTVSGAAHLSPIERADEVNTLLLTWARTLK